MNPKCPPMSPPQEATSCMDTNPVPSVIEVHACQMYTEVRTKMRQTNLI